MTIAAFGERHARALTFFACTVVLAGLLVTSQLPVSLFPSVELSPGPDHRRRGDRPADRMMVEVTRVLEEAVSTVPGLVTVRSVTGRGSCDISLNFRWGLDMDTTLAARPGGGRASAGAASRRSTQIEVRRMDPTVFPVIAYSLTGRRRMRRRCATSRCIACVRFSCRCPA